LVEQPRALSGISEEDWQKTPAAVLEVLVGQQQQIAELEKRLEKLQAQLNQNSSNSNKPPSSDNPYKKPPKEALGAQRTEQEKGKAGAKKGHQGHSQQLLPSTQQKQVMPQSCPCGSAEFEDLGVYHTHQHIELPEIVLQVTHFLLHEGRCLACGKKSKGRVPAEYQGGYGARLSAFIAEVVGMQGNSRSTIQTFCWSLLKLPVSLGGIQKVLDRACVAIKPHYEEIGNQAREASLNHVDETPWYKKGALCWLWVMANSWVAFFMIHKNRSEEAFKELIGGWMGILVSDGYRVYQKWVGWRQSCLAHLIRRAKGLAARDDPAIAKFGRRARDELQRLVHMAKAPPSQGQWRAFYARLSHLISSHYTCADEAGRLARHLHKEMESLYLFLKQEGVEPTNNFAERMIRFAVLWRKRSQGTTGEKGNRWVERILSLRQTCRLHQKSSYEVLVHALDCHFKGQAPDLTWITKTT